MQSGEDHSVYPTQLGRSEYFSHEKNIIAVINYSMYYTILCPSNIHRYFHHVIHLFQHELKIKDTIIQEPMMLFRRKNQNLIVFGIQELCKYDGYDTFLRHNRIIVYNTEQLPSNRWNYMISTRIHEWWDYSYMNIEYLKRYGYTVPTKLIFPSYSECMRLPLNLPLDRQKITLFGTYHIRRKEWCQRLQSMLPEFEIVYKQDGVFYQKYNEFVSSHMIYLNIHYYEPSILEVVRIFPLLCQGHLVFSERSDDKHLDDIYSPHLVWLDDGITAEQIRTKILNHDNETCRKAFENSLLFSKQFIQK